MENKFSFYEIDPLYLEFLYQYDSQVYWNPEYIKNKKPFLGVIFIEGGKKYFIPLTSAKEKHKKLKNISREHFVIYEILDIDKAESRMIYKPHDKNSVIHLLAILDFKKMIPVYEGLYKKIDFDSIEDKNYKNLLDKEYNFCLNLKDKIFDNARKLYNWQVQNKIIRPKHCNFLLLEENMHKFKR
ncbi:type III toxin-antitoxin system ToxN/AbiQ family toxin [Mycoplasmopsis glycophila]|uniref:Type III toxin-antitoxin system ToxN/AbiQ family toxin n=2 Tax=Mycoplasmopsis glycophila TaxID=171285 RepID=A0A449AVE2_9BACT|nr:type III toxin-antitoxin system ToxN/AbiQ family toxin [Mycoplasmopsis glycophila]VEU70540.1 Uncharacterised protein [Mycoplasmopsis glycophila]